MANPRGELTRALGKSVSRRSLRPNLLSGSCLCAILIAITAIVPPAIAEVGTSDLKAKVPDVLEHMIDYMVTLDLALFALVGYFAKDAIQGASRRSVFWPVAVAISFVAASVLSLLYAYWGRLDIVVQLAGGGFNYQHFPYYVRQAVALVVSAVLAGVFVVMSLRR